MADTVSMNFDLEDLIEAAGEALDDAIDVGLEFAEEELYRRIPSHRRETRKAVQSERTEDGGQIGLKFPSNRRYRSRGTETEQIVKQAWFSIEQPTLDRIEATFHERIEE